MNDTKNTHSWSDPYKEKSQWKVDKISESGEKTLQVIDFHTEKLANTFLKTIHVYVDGKLCYDGI